MRIDRFQDTFTDHLQNKFTLDINPVRRVGGLYGHWGDGPKYQVEVSGGIPVIKNPMVLKIIAPIDGRDEEAARPSRVMHKQQELLSAGLDLANPVWRTQRDDMQLMEDLTQNGQFELVDFMTVHTFIQKVCRGETPVNYIPEWFGIQSRQILESALHCATLAASAGYFLDLDSYFALRNQASGEVKVVIGDLGHGVKKPSATRDFILAESRKVLAENMAARLKFLSPEMALSA